MIKLSCQAEVWEEGEDRRGACERKQEASARSEAGPAGGLHGDVAVRPECTGTKGPGRDAWQPSVETGELAGGRGGAVKGRPQGGSLGLVSPSYRSQATMVQPLGPCSCFPKKCSPPGKREKDQTCRPGSPSQHRSQAQSSLSGCRPVSGLDVSGSQS